MMICFRCTAETKEHLDRLLASGAYQEYGEAIAAAVRNQVLMEQEIAENGAIVIGASSSASVLAPHPKNSNGRRDEADTVKSSRNSTPTPKKASTPKRAPAPTTEEQSLVIPGLFSRDGLPAEEPKGLAALPADMWSPKQIIPLDRWVLGQFNRLLPAKANARALIRLFCNAPAGLGIKDTAERVAAEAAKLGDFLSDLDNKRQTGRDDALATAFPTTAEDAEKGRARYANHFVVYQNTRGELSGLMVDFKFINVVTHRKERRIIPTRVAWEFARLPNPVLDGAADGEAEKFSPEERALLVRHIASSLPAEVFAYRAVLEAVRQGHNTPEKIDAALKAHVPEDRLKDLSQSFLASQRSGAVSRMSDLGLIERQRDGVRVSYMATEAGQAFLAQCPATRQ